MSNMKKVAVSASAAAVAGLMMIGGASIMAYLTDEEKAVNTFTVGRVNVDLEEPNYPGNDSASVKNLVPNEEVNKDPQAENTGENDLISYIAYDIPVVMAITSAGNGTREYKGAKHPIELFKTVIKNADGTSSETSTDNSALNGVHDAETTPAALATDHETDHMAGNWISLGDVEYYTIAADGTQALIATSNEDLTAIKTVMNTATPTAEQLAAADGAYTRLTTGGKKLVARRTYGYSKVVPGTVEADAAAANATDPAAESKKLRTTKPIFDSVKMANIIEDQIPGGTVEDITVYNYAIQASNLEGITGAEANNTLGGTNGIKGGDDVPATGAGTATQQKTLVDAFNVYVRQQDADGSEIDMNAASYEIDSAEVASAKNLHGDSAGEIYHTVSISTADKRVYVGNTTTYTVSALNNNAAVTPYPDASITVTAADPTIASVTNNGNGTYTVTGLKPGQTAIKAVYNVDSGNKAEAVLDVIVYPNTAEGQAAAAAGVDNNGLPITNTNSATSNQLDSEGELKPANP